MPVASSTPYVGLKQVTPQIAAGSRPDPTASVSTVPKHIPVASATADPPDEPPATRLAFHGLTTGPKSLSSDVVPDPNRCMFVFPTSTAPASRRRSTRTAFLVGTRDANFANPAVVRIPAVS